MSTDKDPATIAAEAIQLLWDVGDVDIGGSLLEAETGEIAKVIRDVFTKEDYRFESTLWLERFAEQLGCEARESSISVAIYSLLCERDRQTRTIGELRGKLASGKCWNE